MGAKNLAPTGIFLFVRIVYFVVLVLDEGRHAVDFSSRKNPTALVGSEPAILGTRGQHGFDPWTIQPIASHYTD
jgi:hypothetical protein